MNKNGATLFAFLFGAGIGAGCAYIFTKKKYESLIDSEVSSARETYQRLAKELADKNEAEKKKIFTEYTEKVEQYISDAIEDEPVLETSGPPIEENPEYQKWVQENVEENTTVKEVKPDDISIRSEKIDPNTPYEIDATEYGSNEDYNLVSLNYFSNGIVTNDEEEVLEDPATIFGQKLLNKLPVYEENGIYTAYARNDIRRCDYEIVLTGYDYDE